MRNAFHGVRSMPILSPFSEQQNPGAKYSLPTFSETYP